MPTPRRKTGARRIFGLLFALLWLLLFAAILELASHAIGLASGFDITLGLAFGLLAVGIGVLWIAFARLDRHFGDLERLKGLLLIAAGREDPLPEDWPGLDAAGPDIRDLGRAARRAIEAGENRGGRIDDKLAAVVAAAAEGLLVVTDTGLVSLVNEAALDLLGADAVAVGTSIYAILERDPVVAAEQQARLNGAAVNTELPLVDGRRMEAMVSPLGGHGGYVISLPHREPGRRNLVRHDLSLHDTPPPAPVRGDSWPRDCRLEDLPVLVFDSETTGLNVHEDRIVSFGAVRCQGQRTYPRFILDRLVNPGRPIPAQSTAIHGISDRMVAQAGGFADCWPALNDMLDGTIVVGHSIGFDLAILRAECGRHGLCWKIPPALDTGLLYAALYPGELEFGLEALAERLGVTVEGRHTALGDSLVTAEIWLALKMQLVDHGIATYDAARRFSLTARDLLARQREAGWVLAADSGHGDETDG